MITALVLAATLTIEDYATMPTLSSPRIAPDGTRIAYVVSRADLKRSVYDTDVWLVRADGTSNRALTRSESSDNHPRWSPDGTRVAFLSDRDGGKNQIWLIDPDGGEPRRLTSEPTAIAKFDFSPDGKSIAFLRMDEATPENERRVKERDDARVVGEGRRHVHLHIVDLATETVRRVTGGAWSIHESFSWSPDGKTIAIDRAGGLGLDAQFRTDVYLVSVDTGALTPLVVRPGIDRGPAFSPDGKWVAFTSGGGVHDWLVEHDIHVVPASGGTPRNVSKAYDRTPDAISWSDDSASIWIEGAWNTTGQLFRVNVDGTGFTNTTNANGVITDVDVHGTRAAYVFQSLTEPPELYFAGKRLTDHTAAWRNRTLAETRLIRWKNPKDGMDIEALLTLPIGYKPGTRVPLLTFIHGGPASHFDQRFLGYHGGTYPPHVLAGRGFAVLRPNPRGTGAYGLAFRRANRNDWANMPWLDIEAGIDKLIADGIADPNRLGLMGWSYGGYLAAWVLGHSDRFKAYSIGAPVTDLLSFHGTADIRDFLPHYFDQRETPDESVDEMRHAPLSTELLRSQSPLWHLKKTPAKVLIQHGEADDRVPLSQGIMLYRLLDELGVDVTMVTYPRSGHAIREPKLKIDVMKRNVEFFTRVIPSVSEGSGARVGRH
jgi:dipeptidyl aminopeptidase/acylaminoacyl peptidase